MGTYLREILPSVIVLFAEGREVVCCDKGREIHEIDYHEEAKERHLWGRPLSAKTLVLLQASCEAMGVRMTRLKATDLPRLAKAPDPGSDAAIDLGCTCAVLDNNHGRGAYEIDGRPQFWINGGCKIHRLDGVP